MQATIVSNMGNIVVDDANIILLPDQSLIMCYPLPNLNGGTDYHIADLIINNGCFFESQSSLTMNELNYIIKSGVCKNVKLDSIKVFLLNDVVKKKRAYNEYMKCLKQEVARNKARIDALSEVDSKLKKTVATAHEDNGDVVLILYTYDTDEIESIQFKNEPQDNYLFLRNIKRVHTLRIKNTTILKYAAELVTDREAGDLVIVKDKNGVEYRLEYLILNYIVQKITYNDSSKARNILADDYIYVSRISKERKLKYKYHYKKNKSLFLGFNSNVRLDSPSDNNESVLIRNTEFYNNISE